MIPMHFWHSPSLGDELLATNGLGGWTSTIAMCRLYDGRIVQYTATDPDPNYNPQDFWTTHHDWVYLGAGVIHSIDGAIQEV